MKKIKINDIKKKDLDKFYKIKLSNNEFEVIKDFALEENEETIRYTQRFEIFREYVRAIAWVHYNEKKRSKFIFDRKGENSPNVDLYDAIYDEIENRYPSDEVDNSNESEEYKDDTIIDKEDKDTFIDKAKGFDPFFFIPDNAFGGFLILLFLTWLIFGVIFGGGDLEPGRPMFFGHDGG